MIETHNVCQNCWQTQLPYPNVPVAMFPLTGTCCWCGQHREVLELGIVARHDRLHVMAPHCAGHTDPDAWTLEDYARAVITEYRLGQIGRDFSMDRALLASRSASKSGRDHAPQDILGFTTFDEAINALEEAL